jgi:hypothetical protein
VSNGADSPEDGGCPVLAAVVERRCEKWEPVAGLSKLLISPPGKEENLLDNVRKSISSASDLLLHFVRRFIVSQRWIMAENLASSVIDQNAGFCG